jgi:hypothetical protein
MIIWKDICHEYSGIHDARAEKYERYAKQISAIIISFVAASGILSGINTYYGVQFLTIGSLILAGLSTGLLSYSQKAQYEYKSLSHNNYSKKYKQLSMKIDKELAQEYHDRINGIDFIKFISAELIEYFIINDNIPVSHGTSTNTNISASANISTNTKIDIGIGIGKEQKNEEEHKETHDKENVEHINITRTPAKIKTLVMQKSMANIRKYAAKKSNNSDSPYSNKSADTNADTNADIAQRISDEEIENFELFFNSFPGIDLELSIQKDRFNQMA